MNRNFWIVLGIIALVSGCIGGEPEPLPPEMAAGAGGQQQASTPAEPSTAPVAVEAEPVSQGVEQVEVTVPQPIAVEQARAGVGVKGSGYGGGMITEPVSQYFGQRERITFLQIENNMKTFKAMNDRNPRDWEEFERDVLKPSRLQLPELPAGKRYSYDPQQGQLMVETIQ